LGTEPGGGGVGQRDSLRLHGHADGIVGGLARRSAPPGEPEHDTWILGGMANWMAVPGAVAAAWLASLLPESPAWALGSAAATIAYLTLAAVRLAVFESRSV
jgi:hypothetical protein